MTTKRTSAVFGSDKLSKPWYEKPWFGLWGKDKRDWSKSLTDAEIREVERKMSLLNETRMSELDDKMMGDQEGKDLANIYEAAGIDANSAGPRRPYPLVYADDESESVLDIVGRENMAEQREEDRFLADDEAYIPEASTDYFDFDDEATPGVKTDGGFAETQETSSEGLSPMGKYGAKLVMDMFKEREDTPIQTVRGSNITPGRTFDLSSLLASTKRKKRDRYRNKGLLTRA